MEPQWFFIRGGKFCKPPIKVLYKCTFGMPDQGQTLDVWGQHPDDDNPEVAVTLLHGEVTTLPGMKS